MIEYYDLEKLDKFLVKMKKLGEEYTQEELVWYLMVKNPILPAPVETKRYTPHVDITLGIGNDFTASLIMDEDAWEELQEIVSPPAKALTALTKE